MRMLKLTKISKLSPKGIEFLESNSFIAKS